MMSKQLNLSLFLLVLSALGLGRAASAVMESSASYSCCDDATIPFDQNCSATFNIDNKPVAYFDAASRACVAPCRGIEPGRMTPDRCANMTLVQVCMKGSVVTDEKRISFHGEPCSGSNRNKRNKMAAGPRGSLALLLLALLLLVFCSAAPSVIISVDEVRRIF